MRHFTMRLRRYLSASAVALFSFCTLGSASAQADFSNPRAKRIIPEEFRGQAQFALSDAAMARITDHVLSARQERLNLSAAQKKISPLLRNFASRQSNAGLRAASSVAQVRNPLLRFAKNGDIRLEVSLSSVDSAVLDTLSRNGLHITAIDAQRNRIFAGCPTNNLDSALENLAGHDFVKSVNPIVGELVRAGSVQSEGDAALRANKVRRFLGIDGDDVKLCAISDGITSAAFPVSTGDLPGNDLGEPDVDLCPLNDNSGDEGTAMLEIMHDLAPGAELGFCPAFGDNGAQGLADAVTYLANDAFEGEGCDVIVDDVGILTEPFFQDGVVAQAVDAAVAGGVSYFSSAGNGAQDHYELPYTDTDPDDEFFNLHDFGLAAGGPSNLVWDGIVGGAGNFFAVFFQWNEAFGASGNDFNVFIFDQNGIPAGNPAGDFPIGGNGTAIQDGDDDPSEIAFVINTQGEVTPETPFGTILPFVIVVDRFNADPNTLFEMNFNGLFALNQDFNVPEGSVWGHPAAHGAVAVAATGAVTNNDGTENPNLDIIEPFSSRGPALIFFDPDGTANFQARRKPDLTAVDGTSVTGVNFFTPFFGTSASAPHAAAVAALMLDANKRLTPRQLEKIMKLTARDRGDRGFDFTWGRGLVDAFRAVIIAKITAFFNRHRGFRDDDDDDDDDD
ncbi:MAG: S8 family serine peptidase [Gammaproteobacteria bacterium]|nr:S8 family serine peptidase [Gammaproteobacteria bacterium]